MNIEALNIIVNFARMNDTTGESAKGVFGEETK